MTKFTVTGMSCASCSARIEKAVSAVDGVTQCSVNLLTNSMGVEGTASAEAVIAAVKNAGYGAALENAKVKSSANDRLKDTETPKMKRRLLFSLVFLAVLMYFSMGHTMLGLPIPKFFENNFIAVGLLQMLLATAVIIINQKFFISGFLGMIHKSPNMDTLVALGSSAAFIYSVYALFAMTAVQNGGDLAAREYMNEMYFESSAMILALITVGKMLEARSKGKTTDALKGLMSLKPKTATVERDGAETETATENVCVGDIFTVRAGQTVPVDGVVIEGSCALDESSLTGESIPADKAEGDKVSAASVNLSGYIRCRATQVGEDTTLSQIIKTVSDAAATKAPIAKIADRVSGIFVPAVIAVAAVTCIAWLIAGRAFGFALARGISVLVISCPCALGLATPVAIMVGNGIGAKNGILFKTAVSLEETGKVGTVVLDKTGTITEGRPTVTDIIPAENTDETELLQTAYALEAKSEHPLAKAITAKAEECNVEMLKTESFKTFTGNGIEATLGGITTAGGKADFVSRYTDISELNNAAELLAENGKTPLWFVSGEKLLGLIAVADTIKSDSAAAVSELKNMGIKTIMLTGDNEKTARAIAAQAGVDEVIAGVMPDGKEEIIRELRRKGKVAMVGDGINDSPALTVADVGIAIGTGTDIAVDSADIVLMNSRLSDVSAAIRLSRSVLTNIKENLFWAFFYNAICIPVAAGALIPTLGISLNPMIAAAAMSLSSFCVVTNALRLNFINIRSTKRDKKRKFNEVKKMEKTVKIEGMMCPHCEARVKQTFENLEQVDEAVVSYAEGTAVLTLNADLADSEIRSVVEAQGYKVL